MSPPIREFTDPVLIRGRLADLHAKAARIVSYNQSCRAGAPDVSLLDAKQQAILTRYGCSAGQRFPDAVRHRLGRTIDVLESRLARVERGAPVA